MNCPSCAHANPEDSVFCEECGAKLDRPCASCGTANSAAAKFCRRCGHPLAEPQTAAIPERDPRDYTPKHLADRILQSKSALEGERKQVTVLFADVKGSLELAEQVDAEQWHRILDRFFQTLAEGVHRFEGTINQYTGDGIMALFGAPIAHEDHAQRACYAALHLRDELRRYADELRVSRGLSFSVRIGLNSGEVIVGKIGDDLRMDYTAQGHTVGLAARMEQLAEPGKVLLTEHTAALASGYFQTRDLGATEVRGLRQPLHIFELEGVGALQTRFEVARARGLARFVGRDDDMQTLEAALASAREGKGQVVGVVGEAGVGKSRLCYEFAERCRARGLTVLEGHGVPHGRNIPFLPILQVFRAYFGITDHDDESTVREKIAGRLLLLDEAFREVLPLLFEFLGVPDPERPALPMDPEARQRQLFGVLRRLVQRGGRADPGVTLIEDLHWMDAGSEAYLEQWADAIAGARGLLLVNFRPEYRAEWMQKSYYRQLPLLPLGIEAIRELLEDLLGSDPSVEGLADTIQARTAGNPFFTEEVVQSLVESGHLEGGKGSYRLVTPVEKLEVPSSVQSLLAARIDRLAERDKQVLQTAAVIGREFSEPILDAVAGLPRAELREALASLEAAEFLYEQALYPVAEYAFKHPLTQEVALRSQLESRRGRIHGAVARAIEQLHADRLEEHAALLAHHWEEAGEALAAARWNRRAAKRAGLSDQPEALRHWRKVRALAAGDASSEAAQLAFEACVWVLRFGWRMRILASEASAAFQEGRALAEQSGDARLLARVCSAYGTWKALALEPADETLALIDEAIELADEIGDPRFTLTLVSDWAVAYGNAGRIREGVRLAEEVCERARGHPRVGAGIVGFRAYSLLLCTKAAALKNLGRLEESLQSVEEAYRLAREQRAEEVLIWAAVVRAQVAAALGDAERATRDASEAVERAERIGGIRVQGSTYVALGVALLEAERWSEARAAFERAMALHGSGAWYARAVSDLAHACLGEGDLEGARAAVDEARSLMRNRPEWFEFDGRMAHARLLLRTEGAPAADRIEEILSDTIRLAEASGARGFLPRLHIERAELARVLGNEAGREHELREAHRLYTEMGATVHAERLARELSP